jgi:DNA-binding MarR family transcriptional regulator
MAERGTPWLTEPEQRSWRALINVTTGVLAVLDAELRAEHGLSLGEYEVLARLSEEPEHSLRMTDLAGRLRLSPSGITRRIDGLVRAGLVERRQCPSDRRGSNAVLTAEGMRRLREVAPAHVRGVRAHFVDRLSERELANLAAALSNIDVDDASGAPVCDDAEEGAEPEARPSRRGLAELEGRRSKPHEHAD